MTTRGKSSRLTSPTTASASRTPACFMAAVTAASPVSMRAAKSAQSSPVGGWAGLWRRWAASWSWIAAGASMPRGTRGCRSGTAALQCRWIHARVRRRCLPYDHWPPAPAHPTLSRLSSARSPSCWHSRQRTRNTPPPDPEPAQPSTAAIGPSLTWSPSCTASLRQLPHRLAQVKQCGDGRHIEGGRHVVVPKDAENFGNCDARAVLAL